MKFRGHETFFIRKGWLGKGLRHIAENPAVFVSKEENPMDVLGIGSNMVKSLRYWMQATGLSQEPKSGQRRQRATAWGRMIQEYDAYIEEIGTLLLLQYRLATNEDMATAWYFFFQKFHMQEFSRDDFMRSLHSYMAMTCPEQQLSERSVSDDFNCIVNTYVPRYKTNPEKVHPENNIDCPLGELGLMDVISNEKKLYCKAVPMAEIFSPYIVAALLLEQKKINGNNGQEMNMQEVLKGENSLGSAFNLDAMTLLEILRNTQDAGFIRLHRTAGLDTIEILTEWTVEECIDRYYRSLENNLEEEVR